MKQLIVEYVWIDGDNNLRSKGKTFSFDCEKSVYITVLIDNIPEWNYDGSSTKQAFGENSEIILKPQVLYKCPFRKENNYITLCDTYDINNKPLLNNHRYNASEIFSKNIIEEPWFGIEQEFFMIDNNTNKPLDTTMTEIGNHYCGVGLHYTSRKIIDEHYDACIYMDLDISGINAEVALGQWEYQIGPTTGLKAGDQHWISRYIIQRIAEKYNVSIDFSPKPIKGNINGSGCHTNFSTKYMREEGGLDIIYDSIKKLSYKHDEHMEVYGINNEHRMTGLNETASYNTFSSGVGSRSSSIRIPTSTFNNKCGYFEDRRPGANMDPYIVTSALFETTVLN